MTRSIRNGDVSKESTSYFATSVQHLELPMMYLGVFGLPGQQRQFVTDSNGKPVLFKSSIEAEISAFRVLLAKLNRANSPKQYVHKPVAVDTQGPRRRTLKVETARDAAEAIFKKGK